jgi:hypothetical protein
LAVALIAGALAAAADVGAHAAGAPHLAATLAGAALFFGAGRLTRLTPRMRATTRGAVAAAAAGAGLHAALDAVWLVHALGPHAALAAAVVSAAFDAGVDVLAALAGARSAR